MKTSYDGQKKTTRSRVSKNDHLIKELVGDPLYRIEPTGEIFTRKDLGGHVQKAWRDCRTVYPSQKGKTAYYRMRYGGKVISVHRAVYQKFLGDLDPFKTINHKDGNGLNNHFSNLELVTVSENNTHRFRVLKTGPIIGNSKITFEVAEAIRAESRRGVRNHVLVKKYGLSKATISMIISDKIWRAA